MLTECRYSRPRKMHPTKNLVSSSLNLFLQQIWYLKSPPDIYYITRYRFSLSWKAQFMFTIKGCLSRTRRDFSLSTDGIDFFVMILLYHNLTTPLTSPSEHTSFRSFSPQPSTLCWNLRDPSHAKTHNGFWSLLIWVFVKPASRSQPSPPCCPCGHRLSEPCRLSFFGTPYRRSFLLSFWLSTWSLGY